MAKKIAALSLDKDVINDVSMSGHIPMQFPQGEAKFNLPDLPSDTNSPNDASCVYCVPLSSCSMKDLFSWNMVADPSKIDDGEVG